MSVPQFFWYELLTDDPAAALDFYRSVVGWEGRTFPGGGDYTVLQIDGDGVAGLMRMPPDIGMPPVWMGYIHVEDVDAATQKAVDAGGRLHRPPQDIPGAGRMSMVGDPQGAVFHLMTPKPPEGTPPDPRPGAPGFHPTALGRSAWSELHATDWEKAWDFYAGQFGWTRAEPFDMGPLGLYQIFEANGRQIGGMFNSPGMPRPVWLYYFNVASIDAAVAAIAAGGGKVTHGPDQVPGGTWTVQATDPQGAIFGLTAANR